MKTLLQKILRPAWGALTLVTVCGASQADELAAFTGRSVALGDYRGTVYHHPSGAGLHVVVTLDDGLAGHPVRFTANLLPGQTAVLSTPGAVSEEAKTVSFTRDAERLIVDDNTQPEKSGQTVSAAEQIP